MTVWDTEIGAPVLEFSCESVGVGCLGVVAAFQPGSSTIALGTENGVLIADLNQALEPKVHIRQPTKEKDSDAYIFDVATSVGDTSGTARSRNAVWKIDLGPDPSARQVYTGQIAAASDEMVATQSDPVEFVSVSSGDRIARRSLPSSLTAAGPYSYTSQFSRDGQSYVILGGETVDTENAVEVLDDHDWDAWMMNPVTGATVSFEHETGVAGFDLSLDGELFVAVDSRGAVRVWDARTGELVQNFGTHASAQSVAFVGSDEKVAVLTSGGVMIWDIATDERVRIPAPDGVSSRGFSDELKISKDGTLAIIDDIAVWDLRRGQQVGSLDGFDFIFDAEFSADGRTLLATNTSFGVFSLDVGYLRDPHTAVCATTARDLTDDDLEGVAENIEASEINPCDD